MIYLIIATGCADRYNGEDTGLAVFAKQHDNSNADDGDDDPIECDTPTTTSDYGVEATFYAHVELEGGKTFKTAQDCRNHVLGSQFSGWNLDTVAGNTEFECSSECYDDYPSASASPSENDVECTVDGAEDRCDCSSSGPTAVTLTCDSYDTHFNLSGS